MRKYSLSHQCKLQVALGAGIVAFTAWGIKSLVVPQAVYWYRTWTGQPDSAVAKQQEQSETAKVQHGTLAMYCFMCTHDMRNSQQPHSFLLLSPAACSLCAEPSPPFAQVPFPLHKVPVQVVLLCKNR